MRRGLSGLLLLGAVTVAVYGGERARTWVTADGRFPVEEIRVHGNRLLLEGEVLALAFVDRGENLFALSPEAVEKRLEESDWIVGASVSRRPPGTVIIRIEERRPWLLEPREESVLVDRNGFCFAAMGKADRLDLPLLVDFSEDAGAVIRALAEVSPPENDWISKWCAEISVAPDGGVTLSDMHRGTRIELGTMPFAGKVERLLAVYQQWDATGQRYAELDLRYEGQAIARNPMAVSRR